ncbi:MAG: hypothetical protein ACRDOH_36450, partial [Streptosporangiaceae bacterium]
MHRPTFLSLPAVRLARAAPLAAGLALVAAVVPAGQASAASGGCTTSGNQVTCTFTFTGAEQTFTVPSGITAVQVTAIGAAGAPGLTGAAAAPPGGRGAQVTGTIAGLSTGQMLYVEVGGAPTSTSAGCYPGVACLGGFNGGGLSHFGGGGGGASDVRTSPRAAAGSLASRL